MIPPDFQWVEGLFHKHCGNRKRWLEYRRKGVGASDIPILFNETSWSSPFELWCEKTDRLPVRAPDPELEWRRKQEAVIAHEYAKMTGRKIFRPRSYTIFRHPESTACLFCTPDYFQLYEDGTQGILEIKTAAEWVRAKWDEEPPLAYLLQLQTQLLCTGLSRGTLVCSIGGTRPVYKDVDYHLPTQRPILDKARDFMDFVRQDIQPPVDERSATSKALDEIYRNGEEDAVMLPDAAIDWDTRIVEIDETVKGLEKESALLRNRIKAFIGNHVIGKLPDATWTFKKQTREGYTVPPTEFMVLRRSKKGIG